MQILFDALNRARVGEEDQHTTLNRGWNSVRAHDKIPSGSILLAVAFSYGGMEIAQEAYGNIGIEAERLWSIWCQRQNVVQNFYGGIR